MGAVRKLGVEVGEELAGDVEAAVASGDYVSPDEVVADALRAWKRMRGAELEQLRQLWREGIDSGEPIEGNFEAQDIIRRGRARLESQRKAG